MQKLGKYEILAELGHGAMGVVYKARDPFIGRLVALKTINSNLVDRPDLLERFYQEAQSAGKLQHPNIVTVFELGQEKDTPFIAMEYIDGESLEKIIVEQIDLPLALKVGYIVRVCQALEFAHKNRVVHRDIKPGNVMVTSEGVVKVVDFGIARLVDFSRTHTNMMIGTPAYMAPELFRKKKADERTDIWAVGVTFYELICYQRPFTGEGYDIIRGIAEDDFPAASSIASECSPELDAILGRMLRKPSADRYQSMEDVLLELEPVWNRMRADAASVLAERARGLYERGNLPRAQDTLRRARLIDSSNVLAKSLLEKVSAELRRTEIQPKVEEHVGRGRVFLQSGQFREAQAEAEAALNLDSRCEPAQKLVSEVEAGEERAKQLEKKLRLTKQRLAEGAIAEAQTALRQALELDASHPQALELSRQIDEEQSRRERRKKLNELLARARGLWTELRYDECLALLEDGLKAFPNEPELKSLQDTARQDQVEQDKRGSIAEIRKLLGQQKLAEARKALEALANAQPQDTTIKNLQALLAVEEKEQKSSKQQQEELANLRGLVSAGKLREAVARGGALLGEFPQEYEIKDLVAYASGEIAQQEQKRNEQEREKQIEGLMAAQRYREAADVARRAMQEFPKQESFLRLAAEAEQKTKEQEEREKAEREMHRRVQEIQSKIKRQELTGAIDLARQSLETMGPDTDVTRLLQAAEVESLKRSKKREEGDRHLEAARTLLEKEDLTGAKQVLDRAMATRILQPADVQARQLLSRIAEKEEASRAEEQTKKTVEQKQSKPGTKASGDPSGEKRPATGGGPGGSGHSSFPPVSAPSAAARTVLESATSFASGAPRQRPSAPVMTPPPSAPQTIPAIQTQIRVEERVPQPPVAPAAKSSSRALIVMLVVVLGLALAGGSVFAVLRYLPKLLSKPSADDLALEAEAKQLWDNHKLDDSLADWKKLAGHPGSLHDEALKRVSDLEQQEATVEHHYAEGMKLLYEDKKYPEAGQKFNEVIQMNSWKLDEARHEFEIASKGPGGTPPEPLWQALFDEGKQAFARKDYAAALQDLQQVTHADGVSKDTNAQAEGLMVVLRDREEQKKDFDQGMQLQRSGKKQPAKDAFGRVVKAANGDLDLVASAKNQIDQIGAIPEPPASNPNGNANPSKNPPDYAAVMGEVRNLIGQGRWDDAGAKLSSVPTTQPDFNTLKQQLESARREDQYYGQMKTAFNGAHANKNADALLTFRPFFATEVGKADRHSDDARSVTTQIDADLREAAANKTPSVAGGSVNAKGNDAAAIADVLRRYAAAYDAGDLLSLVAVRQFNAKDQDKIQNILDSVKGKGYALQNCASPQIGRVTATVKCTGVFTKASDIKPQTVNFVLRRNNGQWIIVSSN
ncbi:MAG: protein kinase [Candidatus Acidiferrum sp.]